MDFDPRRSLTRNEFCYAEHLSPAKYFDLKKRDLTPVELNIDGIFRITPEAREEWRARMAKLAKGKAAQLEAKRRQELAPIAALSPKHVSRTKRRRR